MDIGLVTCARLPLLDSDDRALIPALARFGVTARPLVWSDPAVQWSLAPALLLRSVWDYSERWPAFLSWVGRVSRQTVLWNPAPVVQWNGHKRYLLDLAEWGLPVVPTVLVEAGCSCDLRKLLGERQWPTAVVKPAVSADARDTQLVTQGTLAQTQSFVDHFLEQEDLLIQPYRDSIAHEGEYSFVYLGGVFSHMVRKRPQVGDFRVQERFGGRVELVKPQAGDISQAASVVARLSREMLYARIDMARRSDGTLEVVELELIEPSLYLSLAPGSAHVLAEVIHRRIRGPRA